jgi:hypothetical protein
MDYSKLKGGTNMAETTIAVTYNGKEIQYNTLRETWEYDGVGETLVKKVNPDMYNKITTALVKEVAEYKKRVEREKKAKQAEEKKRRMAELEVFKSQAAPLIPDGFEADFSRAVDYGGDVRRFRLEKAGVDADIDFSDKVYSSGSYHAHTTDMPWKVEFNYKSQRFATLEKAIANAIKKIDGRVASKERDREYKEKENAERQQIAGELKTLGICFGFDREWVRTSNHNSGYSTEHEYAKITLGEDNFIKGRVARMHESTAINIYNTTISGKMTPDQFKALVEFIKTLKIGKGDE